MPRLQLFKIKKYYQLSFVALLLGAFVGIFYFYSIKQKEREKEQKLEARFDKFMGYYYPFMKEISDASNVYRRMKVSLLYDYYQNHRGRYINETVNYYDFGSFSMNDYINYETFLRQADILSACRASFPIENAPQSRKKERLAWQRFFQDIRQLVAFDYELWEKETLEQTKEKIDSLNLELQSSFFELIKYRDANHIESLNSIIESDYKIDNY